MKKLIALLALLASQQLFVGASAQQGRESAYGTLSLIAQTHGISEEESKLKVIITTGFGTDANSAARNAAENALNEVVGSITSSEKLLEKKQLYQTESRSRRNQSKPISTLPQGPLKA